MNVVEKQYGEYHVLAIEGRLDANTSDDFLKILLGVIETGKTNIVIDFEKLDYISSSGLRVLLIGAKQLNDKGEKINLCMVKDHIQEVFDIAGFTILFKFYDEMKSLPVKS